MRKWKLSRQKSGIIRGLKLSSDKAWKKVGEKDYRLKTESYDFYGKVDKDCSGFVINAVNDGCNTGFVLCYTTRVYQIPRFEKS